MIFKANQKKFNELSKLLSKSVNKNWVVTKTLIINHKNDVFIKLDNRVKGTGLMEVS